MDVVQDVAVLLWEGDIMEQALCQSGLCLAHSFPVSKAEVCSEGLLYLKEEVFGQDIQEGPNDAWVVLDLAGAGLDIIGVDHNVIVWVCDA